MDSGLGVWFPDSGFRLRILIPDSGFRILVSDSGFRIPDSGFRVLGLPLDVQGDCNEFQYVIYQLGGPYSERPETGLENAARGQSDLGQHFQALVHFTRLPHQTKDAKAF